MSEPMNSSNPNLDVLSETPEALAGIAERLQNAINDLFNDRSEESPPDSPPASNSADPVEATSSKPSDRRLYLPNADEWQVRIKSGPREFCYSRNPNEDWFHLLVDGELYLQSGDSKMCLNCAFRHGVVTDDRLFWQAGHRRTRLAIIEESSSMTAQRVVNDAVDDVS